MAMGTLFSGCSYHPSVWAKNKRIYGKNLSTLGCQGDLNLT
jgi:hypothetical protein